MGIHHVRADVVPALPRGLAEQAPRVMDVPLHLDEGVIHAGDDILDQKGVDEVVVGLHRRRHAHRGAVFGHRAQALHHPAVGGIAIHLRCDAAAVQPDLVDAHGARQIHIRHRLVDVGLALIRRGRRELAAGHQHHDLQAGVGGHAQRLRAPARLQLRHLEQVHLPHHTANLETVEAILPRLGHNRRVRPVGTPEGGKPKFHHYLPPG